jgi:rod shape-determining protein MreC
MKTKPPVLLTVTEIIIGLIISLLLVLFSVTGSFKGLYMIFSGVAGNVQADSYDFFSRIGGDLNFLGNLAEVKKANNQLTKDNQGLSSQITQLQLQIKDNLDIVKQLKFDLPFTLEPVRVIRYDENQTGEIIVNKGTAENINPGEILVLDDFAVGEVIEATSVTARVRLITSPKSIVPVLTIKDGTKGLLKGDLGVGLSITDVLTEQKLAENDQVVTAGVNSGYPYGLKVGSVKQIVSVQSELTKFAKIDNPIQFSNLHNLFVIIKK